MKLQEILKRSGVKQKFVAEKLGISETTMSMFLKNETVFRELEDYCRKLGATL